MATAIFRPAFSLHKLIARALVSARFCALLLSSLVASLVTSLVALPVSAQQVIISLDSIEHAAFNAQGLRVAFDALHPGAADIIIADLRVGDSRLHDIKLHCNAFRLDTVALFCGEGTLRLGERPPLSFKLEYVFASGKLDLGIQNGELATFANIDSRLQKWHPVGRFDMTVSADRERANIDLALRDVGFNTDDYSIAGEGIAGKVTVAAIRNKSAWKWQSVADWTGGEAFWSPWYRRAGVRMTANGNLTADTLNVDQARVTLDRLGSLTAGLTWNRRSATVSRWGLVTEPLDLSAAVKEWLRPVLDAHALPGITANGITRYAAEWADGALQSFYAGIEGASLKESTGRLTLSGVNASVPWSRLDETEAEISVEGGKFDDLALGGFRVPVKLRGFDVAISQVVIPFLDGKLRIEDFHARHPVEEWLGGFSGGIEGVSMPRLTNAIGLPTMAGTLNMRIADARYSDHMLSLNGDVNIDVFDGRISIRHLKLIEPLTKTSRLIGDVEARRLDLGLLTSTFSFGSILGRLDADVAGLELQNWKPLTFHARLFSSPGNYRRAISRGALIDISSLGGSAGAAAVRAIPAAGFFNTFSYDNIGIGCTLKDGVCHMEGVRPENNGYVLVEGSGIPSVKVMGYNRDIDWDLLVSRLKAVIAGKVKAVIE